MRRIDDGLPINASEYLGRFRCLVKALFGSGEWVYLQNRCIVLVISVKQVRCQANRWQFDRPKQEHVRSPPQELRPVPNIKSAAVRNRQRQEPACRGN